MRIDEVSSEWTPQERLRVIEHLLGPVRFRETDLAPGQRRTRVRWAQAVSCYAAPFLNSSRDRIGRLLAADDHERVAEPRHEKPSKGADA